MEGKNRIIFVVLIAVVIVVAVFSSFGLNFFASDTPKISMPTVSDNPGDEPGVGGNTTEPDRYTRVEVTPDTVQNIIRTMVPLQPESYHRTIAVQTALGNGAMGTTENQVWVDFGWTMVKSVWPGGTVENTIVGEGKVYRWFDGDWTYKTWEGEERDIDMAQRIPTYEDILELDKKQITATGYEEKGGLACVYVETAENELGNRERYWVSVETGLLVAAETKKGDEVVLSMTSGVVERPVQQGTSFALPDGTLLHTGGDQPSVES